MYRQRLLNIVWILFYVADFLIAITSISTHNVWDNQDVAICTIISILISAFLAANDKLTREKSAVVGALAIGLCYEIAFYRNIQINNSIIAHLICLLPAIILGAQLLLTIFIKDLGIQGE